MTADKKDGKKEKKSGVRMTQTTAMWDCVT